jgi:hypothetical protein
MSKKMILLFSHKLSDEQIEDAKTNYGVKDFIYLPADLQSIWSNIPPDINSLEDILKPIKNFVHKISHKNDIVLIQGDFGAVYEMVKFCKKRGFTSFYATTKRIATEYVENGKTIKKSQFEHRRFREYG